jgi:hypothetical protein
MAQPAQRPPSCSTLLKLLPSSSAYSSPCFPPPDDYTEASKKASFVKLEAYFKAHGSAHVAKFNKCIAKHMPVMISIQCTGYEISVQERKAFY